MVLEGALVGGREVGDGVVYGVVILCRVQEALPPSIIQNKIRNFSFRIAFS